jgi:hypothetical protein
LGFNSGASISAGMVGTSDFAFFQNVGVRPISPIMPIAPIIPVQRHIIEGLTRDDIKD